MELILFHCVELQDWVCSPDASRWVSANSNGSGEQGQKLHTTHVLGMGLEDPTREHVPGVAEAIMGKLNVMASQMISMSTLYSAVTLPFNVPVTGRSGEHL